jgi:hypothetical protein
MRLTVPCAAAILLACSLNAATASPQSQDQTFVADPLAQRVLFMLKNHAGKTLCLPRPASAMDIRQELLPELEAKGGVNASSQDVATAMWTRYPCPFSPARPELRVAARSDVEGAWLFPEGSQRLRYGPQVPPRFPTVKCEVVRYFPGGRLQTAQFAGQWACPFTEVSSLEAASKLPAVASWDLKEGGRLVVHRSDVADHVEEWDVFVVTQPFSIAGTDFRPGDLLEYLRKEKGNDFNAATQFRHLQALR